MGDNNEIEQPTVTVSMPPVDEQSQPPDDSDRKHMDCSVPACICLCCVGILLFIIIVPIYLIYALAAFLLCNKDVTTGTSDESEEGQGDIFQQMKDFKGAAYHMARAVSIVHTRIMICLLTWLIINLSVKSLRRKIILGSHLWQWTVLVVLLLCGCPVITMVTRSIVHYLRKAYKRQKNTFYYIKGLRGSIDLIIYSTLLLLAWDFYFRSSHGLRETRGNKVVFRFVTWTVVSFLIFTLLWLLKKIVLLGWTAQAVYYRFSKRILRAGFQLYFIAQISGTYIEIFTPKKTMQIERSNGTEKQEDEMEKVAPTVAADQGEKKLERKGTIDQTKGNVNVDEARKRKEREDQESKRRAKDMILDLQNRMLSQDATTYEIQKMATYLINLAKLLPRTDDDISDILSKCRGEFPDVKSINKEDLQKFDLDEERAELLYGELQGESGSQQVSYEAFENWMTRAHKTCLALGYTLTDAMDAVNCLNRIMSGFIIAVVLLIWLLLTGIATTKVLVLIASQFVAAGFIFGESCKTLLEGIVFQFVRHPFDVGDRCLIADKDSEMEVKRMGVLTTTFLKIGSKEEAIYPNSLLSSKPIVNLREDPDPTDSLEFSVDKNTKKEQIEKLDEKIKAYLAGDSGSKYYSYRYEVKENGRTTKITIHFKNMMNVLDMTHSQCLEEKKRQKTPFLLQMKEFLKDLGIQEVTH
ncbi:hypothetical protein Ancab_012462 [Ancistrocladus abbreviatus]